MSEASIPRFSVLRDLENIQIKKAAPQIFKRPLLYAKPTDSVLYAGSFLALGPQIYADGIIILDGSDLVGRVGSKHILRYLLDSRDHDWSKKDISEIFDKNDPNFLVSLSPSSSIDEAISVFNNTGFGFIPIKLEGKIIASLSIRDLLPMIANSSLDFPSRQVSTPLKLVTKDTSIGAAIELMLQKEIRNLVVRDDKEFDVLNDRNILEFLFSHDARSIIESHGIGELYGYSIDKLNFFTGHSIAQNLPVNKVASIVMNLDVPCVFPSNDSILTPKDIVIKTLAGRQD